MGPYLGGNRLCHIAKRLLGGVETDRLAVRSDAEPHGARAALFMMDAMERIPSSSSPSDLLNSSRSVSRLNLIASSPLPTDG